MLPKATIGGEPLTDPIADITGDYRAFTALTGSQFDGFRHVDDWAPQRLVTATSPNLLPR